MQRSICNINKPTPDAANKSGVLCVARNMHGMDLHQCSFTQQFLFLICQSHAVGHVQGCTEAIRVRCASNCVTVSAHGHSFAISTPLALGRAHLRPAWLFSEELPLPPTKCRT